MTDKPQPSQEAVDFIYTGFNAVGACLIFFTGIAAIVLGSLKIAGVL